MFYFKRFLLSVLLAIVACANCTTFAGNDAKKDEKSHPAKGIGLVVGYVQALTEVREKELEARYTFEIAKQAVKIKDELWGPGVELSDPRWKAIVDVVADVFKNPDAHKGANGGTVNAIVSKMREALQNGNVFNKKIRSSKVKQFFDSICESKEKMPKAKSGGKGWYVVDSMLFLWEHEDYGKLIFDDTGDMTQQEYADAFAKKSVSFGAGAAGLFAGWGGGGNSFKWLWALPQRLQPLRQSEHFLRLCPAGRLFWLDF